MRRACQSVRCAPNGHRSRNATPTSPPLNEVLALLVAVLEIRRRPSIRERVLRNLILPGDVSFATDAAKEIPVTRLWFVLTIAAVLARAAPAAAQQQPAPAPPDQGNGNWDPPPITKPTTQR
jgi:hypothetical protein